MQHLATCISRLSQNGCARLGEAFLDTVYKMVQLQFMTVNTNHHCGPAYQAKMDFIFGIHLYAHHKKTHKHYLFLQDKSFIKNLFLSEPDINPLLFSSVHINIKHLAPHIQGSK
jgi:hypothetical protein